MEDELVDRKRELEDELKKIDSQIYKLETTYLEETWAHGNIMKGFDGFVSLRSRSSAVHLKRGKYKESDRWFSNSSSSSRFSLTSEEPVAEDFVEEAPVLPTKTPEKAVEKIVEKSTEKKKKRKDPSSEKKKKKKIKHYSDSE